MSFAKFFDIIEHSPIGALVDAKRRLLEETNPDRIYVEDIRRFFNIPKSLARALCEMAVKRGIFTKSIAYWCPNDVCRRVVATSNAPLDPEAEIDCEVCEIDGRSFKFHVRDLTPVDFYSLAASQREGLKRGAHA